MESQAPIGFFVLVVVFTAVLVLAMREPATRSRRTGDGRSPLDETTRVLHIIDGDTLIVSAGVRETTIRLVGIDCPEGDQPWGDTAKYGLIKLIGGRTVRVEPHGKDKYGRTLATVYVAEETGAEWTNVNARMVTLGHAWVSKLSCRKLPRRQQDELIKLQRWARSKNVGLWKLPDPVPPWEWRRNDR